MAGRSSRGGRGGWRGRGARGTGAAGQQRLTDEDGTVLDLEEGGPPKLFPDIEVPQKLEIDAEDKALLLHYRDSLRQFQSGPYFTRRPTDRQREFEDEAVDAASTTSGGRGGGGAGSGDGKAALALMSIDPRYFPEELYTEKDRRQAARSAHAAAFRGAGAGAALSPDGTTLPPDAAGASSLTDYLAARAAAEAAASGGAAAAAGAAAGGGEVGGEDEDAIAMDEHDSDSDIDNDYNQGEHFDDDEGYDDDDGGGGDDAFY